MPETYPSAADAGGNPLVITLESVADISRATVQVCVNRGLEAIELHVDRKPLLLLSQGAEPGLLPAKPVPWWRRPEHRPRCRYCDMVIERGEPSEDGYHRECRAFVEMQDRPADRPGGQLGSDHA